MANICTVKDEDILTKVDDSSESDIKCGTIKVEHDPDNSRLDQHEDPRGFEDQKQPNESDVKDIPPASCNESNSMVSFVEPKSVFELSRMSWSNISLTQHYTRGCLWSPDGTCVLTAINLDGMHLIELPTDLYKFSGANRTRSLDVLTSTLHVKEGGTVYDYCWYPFMNSDVPETCCWLASRQHEPIQLWDAYNGSLRATYRGYNNADEVQSAYSICFSPDGEQLIAGYKKAIRIFATKIPGRDYIEVGVKDPCSVLSVSAAHNDLFVVGSWNNVVNLYDVRTLTLGSLATLEGHGGGITYIKFAPDGTTLFTGARKDDKLLQWDMRNFSEPRVIFKRNVETSQKIYFDISNDNNWLVSGDTKGLVHFWNLQNQKEYQLQLHKDCCNGVGFHPSLPILCSTSGQFHFTKEINDITEEKCEQFENSLIFWWIGCNKAVIQ